MDFCHPYGHEKIKIRNLGRLFLRGGGGVRVEGCLYQLGNRI